MPRAKRAARNPMAEVASDIVDLAKDRAGTAIALVEMMEPHVLRRYDDDAASAWINRRAVPPGDALLAAALATGISIDACLSRIREAEGLTHAATDGAAPAETEVDGTTVKQLAEIQRNINEILKRLEAQAGEVGDVKTQVGRLRKQYGQLEASVLTLQDRIPGGRGRAREPAARRVAGA